MYKNLVFYLILWVIFSSNSFSQISFGGETCWTTGQGVGGTALTHWIGDFNGDGLDDKLQLAGDNNWYVALSKATYFDGEVDWTTIADANAPKYFIADFNGDGMDDILSYRTTGEWKLSAAIQLYNEALPKFKFSSPNPLLPNRTINYQNSFAGDFNGDGWADIIYYEGSGVWKVLINNKNGFDAAYNWATGEGVGVTASYVGDFNGDGYCDKASFLSNGQWYVSKSQKDPSDGKYKSSGETNWANGQGVGTSGHYFIDLNGDGKTDKLNYNASTGNWYGALSAGDHFGAESLWCSGQGIGARGVYVGDFNGDRLGDRVTYTTNGEWWVGLNISPRPTPNNEKIVATWFTNWYNTTDTSNQGNKNVVPHIPPNFWNFTQRDINKTPVIGWPSTNCNIYNSNDINTIDTQIEAMVNANINLIIIDNTNGWSSNTRVRASTDALFSRMENRRSSGLSWIRIAIGLGYEFWGEGTCIGNGYTFPGWDTQLSNQRTVLDLIKAQYVIPYSQIYFNYLNRPLVIAYIADDRDYPLPTPWHYNDFTVINAVNWGYTHGYKNGTKFFNGMDSKRYWGWGGWMQNQQQLLPFNKEQMAIMPGTHIYWTTGGTNINREWVSSGDYYINSWKRVVDVNPNIVTICDWNNWNEETAIEGCLGTAGWKDYHGGNQYDWYLQITKAYSSIFKNGIIPTGTYIRDENYSYYYYWNGSSATSRTSISTLPYYKPIIILPHQWCLDHNLSLSKSVAEESETMVVKYALNAYPNPFNPTTNISYTLPQTSIVTIKVYDILGSVVKTLVDRTVETGNYTESFDGSKFASGIYFVRLIAQPKAGMPFVKTIKMIMTK